MSFNLMSKIGLFTLLLGPVTACSQKPESAAVRQHLRSFSVALTEMAENQLYLSDISASAGESVHAKTGLSLAATGDDAAVTAVTQPRRLLQMVAQVFEQLDADTSDSLSLDEFLLIKDIGQSSEIAETDNVAQADANLTALFTQFAGVDALLVETELSSLLAAQSAKVADFRKAKHPNQSADRAKAAQDLLIRFDINGDGIIDLTELQTMKDALAAAKKNKQIPSVDPAPVPAVEVPAVAINPAPDAGPAGVVVDQPAQGQTTPPVLIGNNAQCVGGPAFDPAGVKNVGNGRGIQFIGGQCLSSADCASGCCANPCGICSGPGAQFQAGKTGCGFGD